MTDIGAPPSDKPLLKIHLTRDQAEYLIRFIAARIAGKPLGHRGWPKSAVEAPVIVREIVEQTDGLRWADVVDWV